VPDDQTTEPLLYGSLALQPFQKRRIRRALAFLTQFLRVTF
jgi:hypothetical protein